MNKHDETKAYKQLQAVNAYHAAHQIVLDNPIRRCNRWIEKNGRLTRCPNFYNGLLPIGDIILGPCIKCDRMGHILMYH